MGPRDGMDGCEKSSTGIRSPNRPARSQSLHRLSYRGQRTVQQICIFLHTGQTGCGAQAACDAGCAGSIASMGRIGRHKFKIAWTYAFAPPFAFMTDVS